MPNLRYNPLLQRVQIVDDGFPVPPPDVLQPPPPPGGWFRPHDLADQQQDIYDWARNFARQPRKRPPPRPPEPDYPEYVPPEGFKMTTKPFYMPYDTLDEVSLRLVGSIIRLHDKAVYVHDAQVKDMEDGSKQFILFFRHDMDGQTQIHTYGEDSGFDLTPFKACYMHHGGYSYWVYRKPVRGCYKQGTCSKNTVKRLVGRQEGREDGVNLSYFLHSINNPPNLRHVSEGIKAIRSARDNGFRYYGAILSQTVALYFEDKNYRVEYKGNPVGILNINRNTLEAETSEITANLWAIRRLEQVGIALG